MKKSILILTGIFPPDIGGPAGYTKHMAIYFSKKKHKVTVLTFGKKRKPLKNIHIISISRKIPRPFRDLLFFLYLIILSKKHDIIFDNGAAYDTGYLYTILKPFINKPHIIKIVGDGACEIGMRNGLTKAKNIDEFLKEKPHFMLKVIKKIQKVVWNRCDKIIVPSNYLASIVNEYINNKEKIYVVYNNINIKKSKYFKFHFKKGHYYFLIAARLISLKNIDIIIKCFYELPENFILLIAGDGPEKRSLIKLVERLNLYKRVIFLGSIPSENILYLMKKSHSFILNSNYEAFPHVILEAFHMDCPVIATNIAGTREIINNSPLAIPSPDIKYLKKSILSIVKNRKLREKTLKFQREFLKNAPLDMENSTYNIIIHQ